MDQRHFLHKVKADVPGRHRRLSMRSWKVSHTCCRALMSRSCSSSSSENSYDTWSLEFDFFFIFVLFPMACFRRDTRSHFFPFFSRFLLANSFFSWLIVKLSMLTYLRSLRFSSTLWSCSCSIILRRSSPVGWDHSFTFVFSLSSPRSSHIRKETPILFNSLWSFYSAFWSIDQVITWLNSFNEIRIRRWRSSIGMSI